MLGEPLSEKIKELSINWNSNARTEKTTAGLTEKGHKQLVKDYVQKITAQENRIKGPTNRNNKRKQNDQSQFAGNIL